MKKKIIYALDFDGVICDSAVETAVTGWKAGLKIWNDFNAPLPPQSMIDKFRLIRPIMETGYEAILIIRLLYQGETVETLLNHYAEKTQQTIDTSNKDIPALKKLFGETRDIWINEDANDWVTMNPLFPSVAEKLQQLNKQGQWFIITTKQERFVTQILNAYQIELDPNRIFGLDRKLSKEAILTKLSAQYPQNAFYFVEDRLPTLLNVLANKDLKAVKLFLATWGYNTQEDKEYAKAQARIELIDVNNFLI